ncbi:MAG: thioredoxin family protein [Promethearchaeota archaeon]
MSDTNDEELERIKLEKMRKMLSGNNASLDFPSEPIHISSVEHFKEIVEKYKHVPIVSDFWAEWCGPCRMLTPIFQQAAKKYQGKVLFIKVNTEQLPSLAAYFQVSSIPLVLLIHEKEVKASWLGLRPLEFYLKALDTFLQKNG